ncbi:hypothetical protein [Bremerella cremea]|uniref:hypothetical protein n=1 Tax=Bremerella cremea TaxID=1031537 RepID=UPI0031F073C6
MRWEFDGVSYATAYGMYRFGPLTLPRMVAEIEALFPATMVVRRDMVEVYEERYREAAAMLATYRTGSAKLWPGRSEVW